MTLRDQHVALSAGDQAVLELLREDRDSNGAGVLISEVERVGGTRFPNSLIKRLHSHGYVVGEMGGLCELVYDPDVERADSRATGICASDGLITPQRAVGSLSAEAPRLFDLPSTSHFQAEAA